tara:strand:+ start:286 stop:537 length:252 start_codon:yes stop_codon:yes gene_type:complete
MKTYKKTLREVNDTFIQDLFKGDNSRAFELRKALQDRNVDFYSYHDDNDNEIDLAFLYKDTLWVNISAFDIPDDVELNFVYFG